MTIVPPLTREQCEIIVQRWVNLTEEVKRAHQRYLDWGSTDDPDPRTPAALEAHSAGLLSAWEYAVQEAAVGQLLALQALERLDLTKGAKLA